MKYFEAKEFILVISIASIATLIMLFAPESIQWLRYDRLAINEQQHWWRLITANFCHTNWHHWLLNLSGLVLIDYFYQPLIKQSQRALLLIFCIFLNVILLHIFMDNLWYVGLSGALHGFLLGGALLSFKRSKYINLIIIITVALKLFLELNWQVNELTEKFIQANILEESHLYGAISAVIYWVIFELVKLIKRNN